MKKILLKFTLFFVSLIIINTEDTNRNLQKIEYLVDEPVFEFSDKFFSDKDLDSNGVDKKVFQVSNQKLQQDSWQPDGSGLGGKPNARASTAEPIEISVDKSYLIEVDYNSYLSDFSFGYLLFDDKNSQQKAIGEDPGYIEFIKIPKEQNKLYISNDESTTDYLYFNFRRTDGNNFLAGDMQKLEQGLKNGNLRLVETSREIKTIVNKESDIATDSWQPDEGQELGNKPNSRRRIVTPTELKTNNLNKIFVDNDVPLSDFEFGYMAFDVGKTKSETIRDRDVEYNSFTEILKFGQNHELKTIGRPHTSNENFVLTLNFRKKNQEDFTTTDGDDLYYGLRDNLKIVSYEQPSLQYGGWEDTTTSDAKTKLRVSTPIELQKGKNYKILVNPGKLTNYNINHYFYSDKDITNKIGESGYKPIASNYISCPQSSDEYCYVVMDIKKTNGEKFDDTSRKNLVDNLNNNYYIYEVSRTQTGGGNGYIKKSDGLSTGGIIAILIPTILLLLGVLGLVLFCRSNNPVQVLNQIPTVSNSEYGRTMNIVTNGTNTVNSLG